jgi:phosphatidylinositol-3-phosphatase
LSSGEHQESCAECGSPLGAGQHYCLNCGARAGEPSRLLETLLGRSPGEQSPGDTGAPAAPLSEPAAPPAGGPPRPALRMPPPRISALLLALFLGFGVVLGYAAARPQGGALAADAGSRLKLVLPSARSTSRGGSAEGGSASSGSSSTSTTSTTSSSEAPSTEPQSTPAPSTAATKTTSSKSGAGTEGGSESGAGSGSESGSSKPSASTASKLPPIKHVFLIALSDEPYAAAFGPISTAHYLTHTLEARGELLVHYDAVAHEELANELALLSGQGPTAETAADCPNYSAIVPTGIGAQEQVLGDGCVYPASTQSLPGQLTARHLTWRAFIQGLEEPGQPAGACAHPALGQPDPSAEQGAGTGAYATFRNPFVYFSAISGAPACAKDDVGIGALKSALATPKLTPALSYIAPDRCHDGNPTPCTAGAPAGMGPADSFLAQVVPEILASEAYKQGGLIVVTVDEAPSSGEYADSSSCCGEPLFPNQAGQVAGLAGLSPRGGGAVGALLISRYVKGATTNQEPFNHFSLLRTIEDLFSLKHLGYAALPGVKSFAPSMFTAAPSK